MNSGFYKDLDTNFEMAYEMSEKTFAHERLIDMLKNGNIPEKQIAAMKIERINDCKEAEILINNLTGCDGKIREAVAIKINQLLITDKKYIDIFSPYYLTLADASIDINGNICRTVIECVSILKKNKNFAKKYTEKLLSIINNTIKEIDKITFRDKKYTVNKQLFKLYWCLESLTLFAKEIPFPILFPIIEKTSKEKEYTIREKTAQILELLDDEKYNNIKNLLKNDENYYVRQVFANNK